MRPDDFGPCSPGRLVPVEFGERAPDTPGGAVTVRRGSGFVPDPLPPRTLGRREILDALYDAIAAAERALSVLEGATQQLHNPHLLIGPFLTREAKLSSAIENTFASARELALFDLDARAVDDRDQTREVMNYIRALEHGLRSELPLCLRLLREMHAVLMKGVPTRARRIGDFRSGQAAIGSTERFEEARYVAPPAGELQPCLDAFESYLATPDDLPRLVRFALLHYQFEAIHPFEDGNGRLGRLLIVLQLCKQAQMTHPAIYVSGFFEAHRQDYYDLLLRVSTDGAWLDWIRFFLRAVESQAIDALSRARRIIELNQQHQKRVREKRASALLPVLVDRLYERPALTIAEVSRICRVTPRAAALAVRRLVEKGILVEATGRKKNRIFIAPEILDVIES